jgi:hypothetical protein
VAGASTGGAVMTAGVLAVRLAPHASAEEAATGAVLVTASLFLGIVAAAASGWIQTRSLDDLWRRGVTAAVSVFGAALLAVGAIPADRGGGTAAVVAYGAGLGVAAITAHLWLARRAA